MNPDNIFLTFIALSLASIFLALVIGTEVIDRTRMAWLMSSLSRSRRELKQEHLHRLTRIADEARKAREQGLKFVPPSAL